MMTRKEKRNLQKDVNYFFEFTKILKHFFKDFNQRLKRIKDHRHQSYVIYGPDVLLLVVLLKNVCNLHSMRSMTNQFNKDECIENIGKITGIEGLEELPHYDTINDFLVGLEMEELEQIRTYMIKELLKKRSLEDFRVNEKYWGVIIDGTGLFSFNERHCQHCLKRVYNRGTEDEKIVYMHHVLEAKLVVGDMVLSIGTEFIENESMDLPKQDCELRAFYRLAERLKKDYPRLPICILGDSLYACEQVFKTCTNNKWKYLIRFKEGRMKTVAAEFKAIKEFDGRNKTLDDTYWVKDIAYNDRVFNMVESTVIEKNIEKYFLFITDMNITKRNATDIIAAGRSRWKIENEGFNKQKEIRYHIEHANSQNYNAMKNHYLITQIADILMQLYENGLKILKSVKKTAKEISSDLLEAIRTRKLTAKDILRWEIPIQVRFT